VADTISPNALCRNETVYLDVNGNASLLAADINNGSSDACGIASFTLFPSSYTCADLGTIPVNLTTADYNGNLAQCTANVTVLDTIFPNATTCPTDMVVSADAGVCGAVVNYTLPVFEDNCDGAALAGTQIAGPASGVVFPIGTSTVSFEYTDAAGNGPVVCSFDVTVNDNEPPVANCVSNFSVELDASGIASILVSDINNGSSDNCGIDSIWIDVSTFDCTNLGANTVTLSVRDVNGLTDNCTSTVTVLDNNNPVSISASVSQQDTLCLDDMTTVNITSSGGVGTLSYTLNGTTNTTGVFSVPAGYSYAWDVTNALGCGTVSGNFMVEIRPDVTVPVFTAGANILCQDAANETYTATATNSNSIS
jgi:hypothetical protein